jgi:hypothetical protein
MHQKGSSARTTVLKKCKSSQSTPPIVFDKELWRKYAQYPYHRSEKNWCRTDTVLALRTQAWFVTVGGDILLAWYKKPGLVISTFHL